LHLLRPRRGFCAPRQYGLSCQWKFAAAMASSPSSGYGFTVGTAAELVAGGPPQPCAGCVLVRNSTAPPKPPGLFSQRGWVTLCPAHTLSARSEDYIGVPAPRPPPPRVQQPLVAARARPSVVSMTARFSQLAKKQQLKTKRQQKSGRREPG
jgi:hypothetical protein